MNKLIDHPAKIVSWITLISILSIVAYTVIDTSKAVAQNTNNIKGITEYVAEQRIANKLMQDMQQTIYQPPRKEEPYCEWENDEKWCWDEKYKEWWRAL